MYGLTPDNIRDIQTIFAGFSKIEEVLLYGSRAKGNYHSGSDIDITLLGKGLSLKSTVYPLRDKLDALYLPYTFDISIFSKLDNDDLIEHILQAGKTFYQKSLTLPNWQTKKLGEVCEFEKTPNKRTRLPYVGLEHIESNTGLFLGSEESVDVKSLTFQFNSSHILYGRLRPYLNKVLMPNFCGHCSTEIFPIKPFENLNRDYLFHWLLSERTMNKINSTCTGARMPRADMNKVLDFPIPLPPLPEQQRIVAILDEAFAAIAKAKENAEKNLKNAREVFESYLQSVFANPGADWEERTLGDVCKTTQGIQVTKNEQSNELRPDLIRYLYISDFKNENNLKYVKNIYQNKIVTTDDLIVVNTGNSAGDIFKGIDGVLSNNLFKVSFDKKIINREFIYYFVTSSLFRSYQVGIMRGTANPHMGHENFNSTPFAFPRLKEQKTIVATLDDLSAATNKLESIYQQKLADLDELKKSLLQKAFAGELTKEAT